MLRYDRPQSLPRLLPMAAPVYTMGASAPTEPPKPIVTAEVSIDDQVLWGLILDSPRLTANRTLVTPWRMLSRMTKRSSSREMSIPTPGSMR